MRINNQQNKTLRAELRNNMSPPERLLWQHLKTKQLGVKFRRQHGIGSYIVDFYCPEKKLVVEIDGEHHSFSIEQDELRDRYLQDLEIKVIRFHAREVFQNITAVLDHLASCIA